jgi:hypothetical protein
MGRSLSPVSALGSNSVSLPKPRESTAISEDLRGGELTPEPTDLQGLLLTPADFAHDSGRRFKSGRPDFNLAICRNFRVAGVIGDRAS